MTLKNILFFRFHENGLLFAMNRASKETIYLEKGEIKFITFTDDDYEESNAYKVKLDIVGRKLKAACEETWNLSPIKVRKKRKKRELN